MTSLIKEITDNIRAGRTTARAEVEKALQRAKDNEELHALLEVCEEEALQRADEIDAKIKRGDKLGRLVGVPYVAKDNFLTKVDHTTAAAKSSIISNRRLTPQLSLRLTPKMPL